MDIFCARHGNTFAAGDRVVFVGANEDPPLTPEGEKQARVLAAALSAANMYPTAIYCGPLKRTRDYAALIAKVLGLAAPLVDARLTEIDYGDWSGLTNDEVVGKLGQGEDLRKWNEAGVWPSRANWSPDEAALRRHVAEFLQMLDASFAANDNILVVSSNGILRYFAAAAAGPGAGQDSRFPFKMRTGHVGKIHVAEGAPALAYWDAAPGAQPL